MGFRQKLRRLLALLTARASKPRVVPVPPRIEPAPVPVPPPAPSPLAVANAGPGATGFMTGLAEAMGRLFTRGDVFGAYELAPGSKEWQQLYLDTLLPDTDQIDDVYSDGGCFEIVPAPNDPGRVWMTRNGFVLRRDVIGGRFVRTGFSRGRRFSNRGNQRLHGRYIAAVDRDLVMATSADGIEVSFDGGLTAHPVPGLPAPADFGGHVTAPIVAVNPDNEDDWVVGVMGSGVWRSRTGPLGPYALMAGSPTQPSKLEWHAGTLYCAQAATALHRFLDGAWAVMLTAINASHVAVRGPTIVVMDDNGAINISHNDGVSWLGPWWHAYPGPIGIALRDDTIGHLDEAVGAQFYPGQILFDSAGTLWAAEGKGVRVCSSVPTSHAPIRWDGRSVGIEMAVVNTIVHTGTRVITGAWDQPFWIDLAAGRFPDRWSLVAVNHGWDVDFALDDPEWLAFTASYRAQLTGYSTDGLTTPSLYPSDYVIEGVGYQHPDGFVYGGAIAVSRVGEVIWLPASGKNRALFRRPDTDGWVDLVIPELGTNNGQHGWGQAAVRKAVTADKTRPGAVLLYNFGPDEDTSRAGTFLTLDFFRTPPIKVSGHLPGFDAYAKFRYVSGRSGHAFAVPGPWRTDVAMRRTVNDGRDWIPLPRCTGGIDISFGAPKPGSDYPTIYYIGAVDGVHGLWRSTDNADSWVLLTRHPMGWIDTLTCVGADPVVYGRALVGHSGSGVKQVDSAGVPG